VAPQAQSSQSQEPPPPTQGQTVGAAPESGTVLVKRPGSDKFEPLKEGEAIPTGTHVDATKGAVRIVADTGGGKRADGVFSEGQFVVRQKPGQTFVELVIEGGDFSGCPRVKARRASTAARRKKRKATSTVRRLWGDGEGRFQTRGKGSATTVRGTKWLVEDRCDATLTRVARGIVDVRDFGRKRTVRVKAGGTYLARYLR
jgi:hypothetical protein